MTFLVSTMFKENTSNSEVPRSEATTSNEASTSNPQPDILLCEQEHHISAAIEQGLVYSLPHKLLSIELHFDLWLMLLKMYFFLAGLWHIQMLSHEP